MRRLAFFPRLLALPWFSNDRIRALYRTESTSDTLVRIDVRCGMISLAVQPRLVEFENLLRAGCDAESATLTQVFVKTNFTFSHKKPPFACSCI